MPTPNMPPQAAQAMMAARARQRPAMQGAAPARPAMSPQMAQAMMAARAKQQAAPAMKKGGSVKKMANGGYVRAADGCATKGKTKGTMIAMKSGGKTC